MHPGRLEEAVAAIDAANQGDPNEILVRGKLRPKELAHAELATEWVHALAREPGEALLLAARAHHLRRWAIPRAGYPAGRKGYLVWRKALQKQHAEEVGQVLAAVGYEPELVARVQALVGKKALGRDPDAQILEDAVCLVFLETQLEALSDQLDEDHTIDVLRKTAKKMSPSALERAGELPLDPRGRALLERALSAA